MRILSGLVAASGLATGVVAWRSGLSTLYIVAVVTVLAAFAVARGDVISRYLRIILCYFAIEAAAMNVCVDLDAVGLWPKALDGFRVPTAMAITVGVFSIACYATMFVPIARRALAIADRYFTARSLVRIPLGFGLSIELREQTLATAIVSFVLLLSQVDVYSSVMLTYVASALSTSLQNYDANGFWRAIFVQFPIYTIPYLISVISRQSLDAFLAVRWRRWLTEDYTRRWLDGHNHYRMTLAGSGADNPDQRIAEDIPRFIDGGEGGHGVGVYNFSITLIGNLNVVVSYAIILWGLSHQLTRLGSIDIPGFLFWCALIYAVAGTGLAAIVGRPLAPLAFAQQHYEANFRFALARLREYSEQIALMMGEKTEKHILSHRFASIVRNAYQLIGFRALFTLFLNFFGQISGYIPYIIAGPFFLKKLITLGDVMQIRLAFSAVDVSLSIFVNYYRSLAEFKSVLDRLTSFDEALDGSLAEIELHKSVTAGARDLRLSNVSIALPNGKPLSGGLELSFAAGQSVLLTGPSGSGKSTLLRVMSGIWPFASGDLRLPDAASMMVLPQRPYLPVGTLMAAVSYPEAEGTYTIEAARNALRDVGLAALAGDLQTDENWAIRLSGGEQQRLAIARALLAVPDWLLLDEATSAMDPVLERDIYLTIARRLPSTTVISVAHRESLAAHHARRLEMRPGNSDRFVPLDVKPAAA